MPNLALLLEAASTRYPTRTAIIHQNTVASYEVLDAAANRVANLLDSLGVGYGDTVALSSANSPQFTAIYYGVLKVGGTVVPMNPMLKRDEVIHYLTDSKAKACFAELGSATSTEPDHISQGFEQTPGCRTLVPIPRTLRSRYFLPGISSRYRSRPVDDDDTAVILYTSGTTGKPKGAELRHRNLRDNVHAVTELFGCTPDAPDVYLGALPMYHAFGQTCVQNTAVANGSTIVMVTRFEPAEVLTAMAQHGVTFIAGVPTMYWALLGALDDDVLAQRISAPLRIALSGGAALPVELHRRIADQLGITALDGYGLSETSPVACFARPGEPTREGSIGLPISGVDLKLIRDDWTDIPEPDTVGEIAIRGHNVMKGYVGRPDATAAVLREGWFRTGDLARRDRDGHYYIVDRRKDLIIRGGFNVYPREVEELLMTHPAVSLVTVVGVRHPSHGEEVLAAIVKNPAHAGITADDIISWSRDRIAAYKYPRHVVFVDALPTTSTGKVLKREVAARFSDLISSATPR